MRITERDLRRVIKNVISETSMDMMHNNMEKANKCCIMPKEELLAMCRQICAQNNTKAGDCCELCYCASKGGTISLVQSLAFEGYDAYSISPGRVDTKMREMDYPGEDPRTRLTTHATASVIFDCINGRYEPGDNIIYRKRGFRTLRRIDKGQPWKKYLNVQPYGTPKEI